MEVNEEEEIVWRTDAERNTTPQQEGSDMCPAYVQHGREEEMHNMMRHTVKPPKMFDFGSLEDALLQTGKLPTEAAERQRVASSCPRP